MRAEAIFYDGISSAPQKIVLLLDEQNYFLEFSSPSIVFCKWEIEKVSLSQIGNYLEIKFGTRPEQSIKVEDENFISALNRLRLTKGKISRYEKLIGFGFIGHISIAVAILALVGFVYFYALPWVAEKAVILIPESYENSLGEVFFNQYLEYSEVDTGKTETLNLFARELDLRNSKSLQFTVVNSKIVNGFALPDGNIVIYTGLLELLESKEELAALIGHEVTHINNRHSMKMLSRNLSGYLFLSVALSDVNGIMAIIGDNIHNLQSLTFSRKFEREADNLGLDIMIANQINPEGMSLLFERLKSKGDNILPEFLSSHPVTDDRIDYISKRVKETNFEEVENPELDSLFSVIKSE